MNQNLYSDISLLKSKIENIEEQQSRLDQASLPSFQNFSQEVISKFIQQEKEKIWNKYQPLKDSLNRFYQEKFSQDKYFLDEKKNQFNTRDENNKRQFKEEKYIDRYNNIDRQFHENNSQSYLQDNFQMDKYSLNDQNPRQNIFQNKNLQHSNYSDNSQKLPLEIKKISYREIDNLRPFQNNISYQSNYMNSLNQNNQENIQTTIINENLPYMKILPLNSQESVQQNIIHVNGIQYNNLNRSISPQNMTWSIPSHQQPNTNIPYLSNRSYSPQIEQNHRLLQNQLARSVIVQQQQPVKIIKRSFIGQPQNNNDVQKTQIKLITQKEFEQIQSNYRQKEYDIYKDNQSQKDGPIQKDDQVIKSKKKIFNESPNANTKKLSRSKIFISGESKFVEPQLDQQKEQSVKSVNQIVQQPKYSVMEYLTKQAKIVNESDDDNIDEFAITKSNQFLEPKVQPFDNVEEPQIDKISYDSFDSKSNESKKIIVQTVDTQQNKKQSVQPLIFLGLAIVVLLVLQSIEKYFFG